MIYSIIILIIYYLKPIKSEIYFIIINNILFESYLSLKKENEKNSNILLENILFFYLKLNEKEVN